MKRKRGEKKVKKLNKKKDSTACTGTFYDLQWIHERGGKQQQKKYNITFDEEKNDEKI